MFEDILEKAMNKPAQDMVKIQASNRAIQMGTIHFKLSKRFRNYYILKTEWNVFYDKKITPEFIKEQIKQFEKVLTE